MRYWLFFRIDEQDKRFAENLKQCPPLNSVAAHKLVDLRRSMNLAHYTPEEYQVWDSLKRVWLTGCDILRVAAELVLQAEQKRDRLKAEAKAKSTVAERTQRWDALEALASRLDRRK